MANYTDQLVNGEWILDAASSADRTRVTDHGIFIVSAGAVANSTLLAQEDRTQALPEMRVAGVANGITVADGSLILLEGGEAEGITVGGHGTMIAKQNSIARQVFVADGATLMQESGSSIGTLVLTEYAVFGYDFNCISLEPGREIAANESRNYIVKTQQIVEDGQTSYDAKVTGNAVQQVLSGGVALGSQVYADGTLIVNAGGKALMFELTSGAGIRYDFGAIVDGWGVDGGTRVIIRSDGSSSWRYEVDGYRIVSEGLVSFEDIIVDGGEQLVDGGEASYTKIQLGGSMTVTHGRANVSDVSGTLILSGADAISNYAEINGGGVLTAGQGSTVSNAQIRSGGRLELAAGAVLNGVIRATGAISIAGELGEGSGGVFLFHFSREGDAPVSPEEITTTVVNDLTLLPGFELYIFIDAADQPEGEYRLAGNAADFTGTISLVTDSYRNVLYQFSGTDGAVTIAGITYSLSLNRDGELLFHVDNTPVEIDTEAPLKLRGFVDNIYDANSVTIYWQEGRDNVAVTGYEFRCYRAGSDAATAEKLTQENNAVTMENLEAGRYHYQARAMDAAGNLGEWSDVSTFYIAETAETHTDLNIVLSTVLWGHDWLPERYSDPAPSRPNDVTGYYFADAEKLLISQDMLYCWGGASSNLLTWAGWAVAANPEWDNEDKVLEYYIDHWKNEGGYDADGFSWFLNGVGATGMIDVPMDGGNLFPTIDYRSVTVNLNATAYQENFADALSDCFDAGFGVGFNIYSDSGMAHAITGWGYEVDGDDFYVYYSDSDSDYWGGSEDRRDAVNRLSRSLLDYNEEDGRWYMSDYGITGTYLGDVEGIRQFDKKMLGQNETFDDARNLEFNGNQIERAGNLDGENDDDYYMFSTYYDAEILLLVAMAFDDPILTGINITLYAEDKSSVLYTTSDYATSQEYRFLAGINSTYYLLVCGSAAVSDDELALGINSYLVSIWGGADSETRKAAGISSADDHWTQVYQNEDYSFAVSDRYSNLNSLSLFSVMAPAASGEGEAATANWIGYDDKADMRHVTFAEAGSYNFNLSAVTGNLTLAIYQLYNDKLKLVRRVSVNAKTSEAKRGIFNLLLDAGTDYFVMVQSTQKAGTSYDVTLDGTVYVQADRGDDSFAAVFGNPDYTVYTTAMTGSAEGVPELSLFGDNWVGFGDIIDYRILTLADAGRYDFTISQLDERAGGKFTIYSIRENGTLKREAVVSGSNKKEMERAGLLLQAGDYVVSFASTNWKSGYDTDYAVALSGTAFAQADLGDDSFAAVFGNADYTVFTAVASGSAEELSELSLFGDNWVGFGDSVDYRILTLANAGSYEFTLSQLDEKAGGKFTIYSIRENGTLKREATVSGSNKKETERVGVLLQAGDYVVSFASTSWKSGRNTDYTVTLSGTAFGKADASDNNWQNANILDPALGVNDGWVGFSDLLDWYRFDVVFDSAAVLSLSEALGDGARVTLYREGVDGRSPIKITSTRSRSGVAEISRLLDSGVYYLNIEAQGAAKKAGTDYQLGIELDAISKNTLIA